MNARLAFWGVVGLLLGVLGWCVLPRHGATAATVSAPPCPLPPAVATGDAPLQSPVPSGMPPFALGETQLQPRAGFSVAARVLGREDYRLGREAGLSPTDLALGWGRMADDGVLARLDIVQAGRWYHYRWRGNPPIPPAEIARSSANMHLVPADAAVAAALERVRAGDRVRIEGWLVDVAAPDGWRWRSSLSREDTGAGACELVYACAIRTE